MDDSDNILFTSKKVKIKKKKIKFNSIKKFNMKKHNISFNSKLLLLFVFVFIILGFLLLVFYFIILRKNNNPKIDQVKIHNIFNSSLKYDEFDDNINEQYIQIQNYYCEKQKENIIEEYEKKIGLQKVNYSEKIFDMFVYNIADVVSSSIRYSHSWEGDHTKKVLNALNYYSKKKNIDNKDIYILDIGSNIGWYSFFLGKFGYKIISFEASKINNYIMYKNYCLNKDVSITMIDKGLDKEDKNCTLKIVVGNAGDGMIFCENREKPFSDFNGDTYNNIELTTLSRYINFLSKKNLAFIKIDVEGAEGNVIEGGKELFNKYHVPFIMMEFEVKMLDIHQTKALELLQFFENNGYKISLEDFFSKNYISSSELIKSRKNNELFIVYEKILE